MAESEKQRSPEESPSKDGERASTQIKPAPAKPRPRHLPPWKVLLHNDDVNVREDVLRTVVMIAKLTEKEADSRVEEAERQGVSLLLATHQERAELYQQQFTSKNLTVTIEPAE